MNRNDFPQISDDLIYFDNAATTFKPQCVIDRLNDFYAHENANVYRGLYDLSVNATQLYDEARKIVANFINAEPEEIIFTSGATDSINKFTQLFDISHKTVAINAFGHHSNILPWREYARSFYYLLPENDALKEHTDIVAMSLYSNVFGWSGLKKPKYEKPVFIDAAQMIVHQKIDVKKLNCAALAFSGHKIYGPMGIGVLYVRKDLLETIKPTFYGGEMVDDVTISDQELAEIPRRFEAGTPNIAGAVGLAEAIKYFSARKNRFWKLEQELAAYAWNKLTKIAHLHPISRPNDPIISFTIDDVHPHDVAQYLATKHICVRAGYHCAQLGLDLRGIGPVTRVSLAPYNTTAEIDKLIDALMAIRKDMKIDV